MYSETCFDTLRNVFTHCQSFRILYVHRTLGISQTHGTNLHQLVQYYQYLQLVTMLQIMDSITGVLVYIMSKNWPDAKVFTLQCTKYRTVCTVHSRVYDGPKRKQGKSHNQCLLSYYMNTNNWHIQAQFDNVVCDILPKTHRSWSQTRNFALIINSCMFSVF